MSNIHPRYLIESNLSNIQNEEDINLENSMQNPDNSEPNENLQTRANIDTNSGLESDLESNLNSDSDSDLESVSDSNTSSSLSSAETTEPLETVDASETNISVEEILGDIPNEQANIESGVSNTYVVNEPVFTFESDSEEIIFQNMPNFIPMPMPIPIPIPMHNDLTQMGIISEESPNIVESTNFDPDEQLKIQEIESTIINGIITDNIKFFKDKFADDSFINKEYYVQYLNDYINGNFCEIEFVFDKILENIDDALVDVLIKNVNTYGLFIKDLFDYIVSNKKINELECLLKINIFLETVTQDRLEYLFGKLIENFNYKEVKNLFYILLKNKEYRRHMLDWFSKNIESFKHNKNILPIIDLHYDYVDNIGIEDKKIINITLILLEIWNNGISLEKLKKIIPDNDNFLSRGFFNIHKCLDYGFINLIQELDVRIKEKRNISRIQQTENPLGLGILLGKINKRILAIKSIINDKENKTYIKDFLKKTIMWFNNHQIENDDILSNICLYFRNNNINLEPEITKLILILYQDNKLSKNPNLKIDFLEILNREIEHDLDSQIFNKELCNIVLCFPKLFSIIKDSYQNEELYDLIYASTTMTQIINNTVFHESNYKYYFEKMLKNDSKLFKKFVYNNVNTLQYCYDEILLWCEKIKLEEDKGEEKNDNEINSLKFKINSLNYTLSIFMKNIEMLCKEFDYIILSDEVKDCFGNILVDILNKYTSPNNQKFKIKLEAPFPSVQNIKLYYSHKNMVMFLINTIINITYNSKSFDLFALTLKKNSNYTKESLLNVIPDNNVQLNNLEFYLIESVNKKINTLVIEIDEEDVDIPEEFCDPIMSTIIEKPVMLPNNIIMDYSVISRHLINDETNPFNRDKLTIEELDEYNKTPDIVIKINDFKSKLEKFKSSIKK